MDNAATDWRCCRRRGGPRPTAVVGAAVWSLAARGAARRLTTSANGSVPVVAPSPAPSPAPLPGAASRVPLALRASSLDARGDGVAPCCGSQSRSTNARKRTYPHGSRTAQTSESSRVSQRAQSHSRHACVRHAPNSSPLIISRWSCWSEPRQYTHGPTRRRGTRLRALMYRFISFATRPSTSAAYKAPPWHASTAGSATRAPTTATANGTNTPAWRSHERSPLLTDESAQRHCRCYCRCHGRGLDQRLPQLQLRARHHDRTSQGRRVVAHQPAAAGTAGAWSPPASAASESAVCRHHTCTTRPQHTYATKLLSCSSHQLRKHGALRHIAVGRYGRVVPGIGDGRGEYRWCVQHTHCEWHVARTPCQQHLRCHYHRRHLWQPHSPQTLPLKPGQSEHHQRHWSRVLNHYQQAAATIEARRWLSGVAATRAWVP